MKLFVVPNYDKKGTPDVLRALGRLTEHLPIELLFTPESVQDAERIPARYLPAERAMRECDAVLSIGGDGTLLHAAKAAVPFDRPILGINTGHLGFLCSIEADELGSLEKLLSGDYTVEERMLLSVRVSDEKSFHHHLAFNDAAVTRGAGARLIDACVYCDGRRVARYRADGVVFSTPSGSSAYAMSAGGPIVDPSLRLIEMTPVCAHSLFARPMLFSAQTKLSVTVPSAEDGSNVFLNIDGEQTIPLTGKAVVTVTAASECVRLINLNGRFFCDVIGKKLLSGQE